MANTNTAVARNRRARVASLCACGVEELDCIVESQIDGDCSAHDERLAGLSLECEDGIDESAWDAAMVEACE